MLRLVATPRLVNARLRQNEATLLRAAGLSYDDIAARLGYGGRGAAYKAVKRVLDTTRDRAALVHRLMSRIRLERSLEVLAGAVEAEEFEKVLRVMDALLDQVG